MCLEELALERPKQDQSGNLLAERSDPGRTYVGYQCLIGHIGASRQRFGEDRGALPPGRDMEVPVEPWPASLVRHANTTALGFQPRLVLSPRSLMADA
jgi:hypothetical protein